MLWTLLKKDFRRTRRNPWGWIFNLSLPLAMTALFGFAFGGSGKGGASVAKIKIAIVDEDKSIVGSMLRSAISQGDAASHFEVQLENRTNAASLLRDGKISAALVVPAEFTKGFFSGKTNLALEVIKNPAHTIYPAVVEEMTAVVVTGLNAVARNLGPEMPYFEAMFKSGFSFDQISAAMLRLQERFAPAKKYLSPPLVQYARTETVTTPEKKEGGLGIFAYILPGVASAFLLFLADNCMRDLHRERRMRTLDRLRTMTNGVGVFITSKVLYAAISVFLGSGILFGLGTIIFGVDWKEPWLLAAASLAYSVFAAGFLAMLVTLARNEKRTESMNSMILFAVAFAGGSYFPAEQLPAFIREHVCPLMPNYWFIEAVRGIANGTPQGMTALGTVLKLALVGVVLAAGSAIVLQKRLTEGARA